MLASQNVSSLASNLALDEVLGGDDPLRDNLDCPVNSDEEFELLDKFSFWVEGVLQTVLAVFGIIGNTIASVIISRKEMRNSFNLLLVSLACFDSTFLFGSILESIREDTNRALAKVIRRVCVTGGVT